MIAASTWLIVNADDFGLSYGVNLGIIEVHRRGILTSASLMVRGPTADEAADYGRANPDLSLGLHIDLGEWAFRDGGWEPVYQVVATDNAPAVEDEVERQLAAFRQLVGRNPTHLDSHQHVHRSEPVRSILLATARALGIPLRDCEPRIRYCGDFYGQSGTGVPAPDIISVAGLLNILAALPPGITELGCHPGFTDDLDSGYRAERDAEVRILCDSAVLAMVAAKEIRLTSFADLRASFS